MSSVNFVMLGSSLIGAGIKVSGITSKNLENVALFGTLKS